MYTELNGSSFERERGGEGREGERERTRWLSNRKFRLSAKNPRITLFALNTAYVSDRGHDIVER